MLFFELINRIGESMNIGWKFAEATTVSGGNDGAIDTFAGTRVHSMVREIIQNSLDAHDNSKDEPVRVAFSLHEINRSEIDGLDDLTDHLKACRTMAKEKQKNKKQAQFYESAARKIKKLKVPVLCVSDFNTTGLTGSTSLQDASGQWIALTKGVGLTQKMGGSLGSYGHGSKAPFTMSPLRTIYYLTDTENLDGEKETRFQGKSLLQSHYIRDKLLDGTGYFGVKDGAVPLINEKVPAWATSIRSSDGAGKGTSIIIPYTDFDEGLFPETLITVIANFYYVIKLGKLEVSVDKQEITKENVDEHFRFAQEELPNEQDGIDPEQTRKRLKTILTILKPQESGSLEIQNFGKVDWFLRVGDDDISSKSVSIARESGMFITEEAEKLKRFPASFKPFNMFVHVNPGEGSNLLKDMENPAHDKFELDRINSDKERKRIKEIYTKFTDEIKELIKMYAEHGQTGETDIHDFDQIYARSISSGENNKGSERGDKMFISEIRSIRKRPGSPGSGTGTGLIPAEGEGKHGGKGKPKGQGGDNVTSLDGDNTETEGGNLNVKPSAIQAEALRISRQEDGILKVHFNCYKEGDFQFQLFKVGEGGLKTPVILKVDGKDSSLKNIKIHDGITRGTLTVELKSHTDSNFTMEGWLNEIK